MAIGEAGWPRAPGHARGAALPRCRRRRLRARLAVTVVALGGVALSAQPTDAQVLTYHNDTGRTGQTLTETVLTPANVNTHRFGRVFSYPVDGYVYAQPLYMPNVTVPGRGTHNVVFVATEHDSVYAFDADDSGVGRLWQVSLVPATTGATTVPESDVNGGLTGPEIGITGTPVIDGGTGTLYVVAETKEVAEGSPHYVQRLHALDLATGAEKFGGPAVIGDTVFANGTYTFVRGAAVAGTGDDSVGGQVIFNAMRAHERAALLLLNGVVYIAWASHTDTDPYHGWLIGYDAQTLQQVAVFNTTPNGAEGGIWMGGGGPVADSGGHIYLSTGNGTFDLTGSQTPAYGDSVLKLSTGNGVSVADSFTPFNQAGLAQADLDLGSGGVLLLPDQPGASPHLMVTAGKDPNTPIYLINRDDLGGYQRCGATCDAVVQTLPAGTLPGGSFDTPAYFDGRVYYQGQGDVLKLFQLSNGRLSPAPVSQSGTPFVGRGATPSVSANGSRNAIVWTVQTDAFFSGGPAILHAYDALDLSRELYNSSQSPADEMDGAVKFTVPTVANGKVFVGTQSSLAVFGLRPARVAVYRPLTGQWFTRLPNDQTTTRAWGCPPCGDVPAYADYDGDGTADAAVYRPSTGMWYILRSSDGTPQQAQWGVAGDLPVPGDFDGDGKADLAVYRPSTGMWYIRRSSDGTPQQAQWGASGDTPVPRDYDGDGKADLAVYRPSTGMWYIRRSSDGAVAQVEWGGVSGDIAVPGDFDGDGRADPAVYRPGTGMWYVLRSRDGAVQQIQWGATGDQPLSP